MKILTQPIEKEELLAMASKMFGNLVKGVVDIEHETMAIDAELHVDLAELLVEHGSKNKDLWGINIYPEQADDDWLEFDSMINLKPSIGNRSRGIEDLAIKDKVRLIVKKFINL